MAYVTQSQQCDLPNSETPISQAQIDAQAARVGHVGAKFVFGNQTMSALVAGLTPPVPTGSCSDFTSSLSMRQSGRFPLRPFARGRFPLPVSASPAANSAGLIPALSTALAALALPIPLTSPDGATAGVVTGGPGLPGVGPGGSAAPGSTGAGTPFNNTGWPAGGANPAGVEYPYGGVQHVLQMIAPTGCSPTGSDGDLSASIDGVAAGWWLGLGLLALALLASGDDKK